MNQDDVIKTLLDDRSALAGLVWSIVRDFHTTEDICQDTIIRATRHVEEFESPEHLINWSRKVARNLAVDQVRASKNRAMVLDADVLDKLERVSATSERVSTDDVRTALSACLDELTGRARHMIDYRYKDGKTVQQIAEMMELRLESAYQAFYRTHKKLGDCIETRLKVEGGSPHSLSSDAATEYEMH